MDTFRVKCILCLASVALLLFATEVYGHGALTIPSSRQGGNVNDAGQCKNYECLWFSQITQIPGEPTINFPPWRTYNINVTGGEDDWSATYPWRAPGTAPVRGSGCGVAGGSPYPLFNGGMSPPGIEQGMDGILLPKTTPTVWVAGSNVEVGFAITANHGGGYSYRLCKADGVVNEDCFTKTVLQFASDKQWIQMSPLIVPGGPRYEIPLYKISNGTYPPGSEWARNPVTACHFCDQLQKCGPALMPNYTEPSGTMFWGGKNVTYYGGQAWIDNVHCGVVCAGEDQNTSFVNNNNTYHQTSGQLCGSKTQFPELLPGLSGFVTNWTFPELSVDAYSIVDLVTVPSDLPEGDYILSWRWDCEQSPQIWQNCADIYIKSPATEYFVGEEQRTKNKEQRRRRRKN
eukprot:TRINITY_DN1379_c0_g1_i1.p1 TRINITY_DN1379_c0_g1~~TRINITY_DN1379_c0_g1_i1.p1  ORF type:complete len:402 (-),score=53.72 TRINITY_DN1379_c0_g1_i1:32-1237(-)